MINKISHTRTLNFFDKSLLNESIYDNPYPIYKKLRNRLPICWSRIKNAWIISRYKDIKIGLRHEGVSAQRDSTQTKGLPSEYYKTFSNFYGGWLMYKDPPTHGPLKAHACQLFSRKIIQELLPGIRTTAEDIISNKINLKEMDIPTEYAHILASQGIADLIGINSKDYQSINSSSNHIVDFMQGRFSDLAESLEKTKISIKKLRLFVNALCLSNNGNESSSLFKFFNYMAHGSKIKFSSLASIIENILIDGHEPIASSISNAILALSKYPSQLEQLVANPSLIKTAVDEFLRFDPPFQYVVRNAKKNFFIRDTLIKKNQRIIFLIASGNRDESIFEFSETLDVHRKNIKLLSFGFDHHYCLGHLLAKEIMRVALEALIDKLPNFRLFKVKNSSRYKTLGSRTITSLNISW